MAGSRSAKRPSSACLCLLVISPVDLVKSLEFCSNRLEQQVKQENHHRLDSLFLSRKEIAKQEYIYRQLSERSFVQNFSSIINRIPNLLSWFQEFSEFSTRNVNTGRTNERGRSHLLMCDLIS